MPLLRSPPFALTIIFVTEMSRYVDATSRLARCDRAIPSAFLAAVLAACAPAATTDGEPGPPVTGRWGGEHVALELTATGGAVEYDCAHGGLTQPLRPRSQGEFEAVGVHVREHGGPIRAGERPDSAPARYVGRVSGDRMTLLVYAGSRPDTLGPFDLRRGQEPRLFKCL